jgi:hypothetical protein
MSLGESNGGLPPIQAFMEMHSALLLARLMHLSASHPRRAGEWPYYTVVNGRVIVDQGRLVNAVAVGTEPGAELQGAAPSGAAAGRISSAARRQTPRH